MASRSLIERLDVAYAQSQNPTEIVTLLNNKLPFAIPGIGFTKSMIEKFGHCECFIAYRGTHYWRARGLGISRDINEAHVWLVRDAIRLIPNRDIATLIPAER
jgi:hypothetical protein